MFGNESTSRRGFVQQVGGLAFGASSLGALAASAQAADKTAETSSETKKVILPQTPDAILQSLKEGNQRFASGQTLLAPRSAADFERDIEGQSPPAVILGCADSRVPPEFVFDQPIGGLFVLRVAGNIVGSGPILLGSIEFAVAVLGARLIVVMGHSKCGACQAAIDNVENNDSLPGSIEGMIDYIRPVVREIRGPSRNKLVEVTKRNAVVNAKRLESLGPILPGFVKQGDLKMVGAYYEMSTGKVEFLA